MDEFIRPRSVGYAGSLAEAPAEKLAFLRKVYGLFTGSLVAAFVGAMVALNLGAGMSKATVQIGHALVTAPPLVVWFSNHFFIGMFMMLGAFFGAQMVRERPGINVAALFGATFFSGIYIAPVLWIVQAQASQGLLIATSPIRDAFLLTVLGFAGLTSYALLSKRDFSFLRSFLSMGLFVVLGAMFLSFFVGGTSFSLAIASVGILLFGGFVLYDTSRMLRDPSNRDPVGAAIGLYLNFLNIFLFLLRIIASGRRDS
jgi:modulator of FtsH protease